MRFVTFAYFEKRSLNTEPNIDQHRVNANPIKARSSEKSMEKLIGDMMTWANVTEQRLEERRKIATDFGETLSWRYLCYVHEHPVEWRVPTRILYGERDNLTSKETISAFAERVGAELTVMPGGEHWFHTAEQMRFLDVWISG